MTSNDVDDGSHFSDGDNGCWANDNNDPLSPKDVGSISPAHPPSASYFESHTVPTTKGRTTPPFPPFFRRYGLPVKFK